MASTQSEPQPKITKDSEEPRTHVVAIAQCDDRRRVVPGHLLVKKGDKIIFQSIGAGPLVVMFPRPIFEENQESGENQNCRINIEDREYGDSGPLTVIADPGCYPYVAFNADVCSFAEGGSEPKVIVRR